MSKTSIQQHLIDYWSGNPAIMLVEGSFVCEEWVPDLTLGPNPSDVSSTAVDMSLIGKTQPPPGLQNSLYGQGVNTTSNTNYGNLVLLCSNVPSSTMSPPDFCQYFMNMRTNVFHHTRVFTGKNPGEYLILIALRCNITPRQANLLLREYRRKPIGKRQWYEQQSQQFQTQQSQQLNQTQQSQQSPQQHLDKVYQSNSSDIKDIEEQSDSDNYIYPKLWWVREGTISLSQNTLPQQQPQQQQQSSIMSGNLMVASTPRRCPNVFLDFFPAENKQQLQCGKSCNSTTTSQKNSMNQQYDDNIDTAEITLTGLDDQLPNLESESDIGSELGQQQQQFSESQTPTNFIEQDQYDQNQDQSSSYPQNLPPPPQPDLPPLRFASAGSIGSNGNQNHQNLNQNQNQQIQEYNPDSNQSAAGPFLIDHSWEQCMVCLEVSDTLTELGGGVRITLLCGHSFHSKCLSRWLDLSCPVCRFQQFPCSYKGGNLSLNNFQLGNSIGIGGPGGQQQSQQGANTSSLLGFPGHGGICEVCTTSGSSGAVLHMCLVCGFTACCGQSNTQFRLNYTSGNNNNNAGCPLILGDDNHAYNHSQESGHNYALEIATQRVFDYRSYGYVQNTWGQNNSNQNAQQQNNGGQGSMGNSNTRSTANNLTNSNQSIMGQQNHNQNSGLDLLIEDSIAAHENALSLAQIQYYDEEGISLSFVETSVDQDNSMQQNQMSNVNNDETQRGAGGRPQTNVDQEGFRLVTGSHHNRRSETVNQNLNTSNTNQQGTSDPGMSPNNLNSTTSNNKTVVQNSLKAKMKLNQQSVSKNIQYSSLSTISKGTVNTSSVKRDGKLGGQQQARDGQNIDSIDLLQQSIQGSNRDSCIVQDRMSIINPGSNFNRNPRTTNLDQMQQHQRSQSDDNVLMEFNQLLSEQLSEQRHYYEALLASKELDFNQFRQHRLTEISEKKLVDLKNADERLRQQKSLVEDYKQKLEQKKLEIEQMEEQRQKMDQFIGPMQKEEQEINDEIEALRLAGNTDQGRLMAENMVQKQVASSSSTLSSPILISPQTQQGVNQGVNNIETQNSDISISIQDSQSQSQSYFESQIESQSCQSQSQSQTPLPSPFSLGDNDDSIEETIGDILNPNSNSNSNAKSNKSSAKSSKATSAKKRNTNKMDKAQEKQIIKELRAEIQELKYNIRLKKKFENEGGGGSLGVVHDTNRR